MIDFHHIFGADVFELFQPLLDSDANGLRFFKIPVRNLDMPEFV